MPGGRTRFGPAHASGEQRAAEDRVGQHHDTRQADQEAGVVDEADRGLARRDLAGRRRETADRRQVRGHAARSPRSRQRSTAPDRADFAEGHPD